MNCIRGVENSKGYYIKMVDADDIILENCIEDCVDFLKERENEIVVSKIEVFGEDNDQSRYMKAIIEEGYKILKMSYKEQYKKMLDKCYIVGPIQVFYSRSLWDKVGGYDERFRFMEDYPFNLKIFEAGYKISFLEKTTGKYRISNHSLCQGNSDKFIESSIDLFNLVLKGIYIKKHKYKQLIIQTIYCYVNKKKILYGEKDKRYKRATVLYYLVPFFWSMLKRRKLNKIVCRGFDDEIS